MLYKRKALILAKPEVTYGVDPVPAAANAILVNDLTIKPAEGDKLQRQFLTPDMGTQPFITARQHQAISFSVELKGAGAAGDVPECGPLLRSCGCSETITAGVSVTYQLVSGAFESMANYCNMDGILHALLGVRGSVKLDLSSNKFPSLAFDLLALSAAPTDTPAVNPVYSPVLPVEVNKANTSFTIGGFAGTLHQFAVDMGWKTLFRDLPNLNPEILLTGREVTGSLAIDAPTVSEYDFWTAWHNSTSHALAVTHGVTDGGIVEIAAGQVQLDTINYGDQDDILTLNQPITLARGTGDDELTLTFR